MKKLFFFAVCFAAAFTSCDMLNSISNTKMDTLEATQKVVDGLKKNIDYNKWRIYNLYWMDNQELDNNLTLLCVNMVNKDNDCFTQTFILGGQSAGTIGELKKAIGVDKLTFDDVKGITPEMIIPEAVQKQYEAAKAMIPEEYDFKSIDQYRISEEIPSGNKFLDRNKNIGEIKTKFTMNMTERGKEYVESAGKKSLQYYEVNFNVLPDGSVEIDE